MSRGEAGARLDEARVPLRNLDGEPRRDDGPLARLEHDAFAGGEVEPGVAVVGLLGHVRVGRRRRTATSITSRTPRLEVVLAGDEIAREPSGLGAWEPRADADSLGCVAPLGDRRAEVVERCEGLAVGVRDEQPDVLEPIGEELGDPGP